MSLPPFAEITKDDYKTLLVGMLQNDFIELTEEKGLIVGLKGERLVNSFKFYAVFKDSEDYTVRCESDEIGTITTPPPVGDRFALAGRGLGGRGARRREKAHLREVGKRQDGGLVARRLR